MIMKKRKVKRRPITVYLDMGEYNFIEDKAFTNDSNLSTELRRAVRGRMDKEGVV